MSLRIDAKLKSLSQFLAENKKSIEDMTTCMDASMTDAWSNRLTNRQVYKSLDNWICKYFDKSWERLSQFLYVDQNTSACFFIIPWHSHLNPHSLTFCFESKGNLKVRWEKKVQHTWYRVAHLADVLISFKRYLLSQVI